MHHPDPAAATEGVVKYHIDFTPAPAPDWALLAELDAWRGLLFKLGLTGLDPARYGGLAYGNVSLRTEGCRFLVSGTQTGGIERLTAEHYCWVTDFDVERNALTAEGPIRPSSEALTHAAVYRAAPGIGCVLHVHAPELWRRAAGLGLPVTDPAIAYGTPAMALAVEALLRQPETRVIAMGGHEDGLIAVGKTVDTAAMPLIRKLAEAAVRNI
ncbi:Ribulose-5-phosphate 4-epimerase/Fuculose-1-phosphate aldolase [Methylomagnum ishizawai]|uniref:Ribulose-5-phosphate 4-epimerase/Fuculose-1-phosphate aldolase n=2 Tax=Methylomagnum ishizawai TaxID=1760988 RepID=A0A1Y6D2X7_9GAMM|nr:Ribulose-5-phosphate 4-epimerase/Fuculose-1-phosphate aldolase [Methylomagnum ishizawai]